MGIACGLAWLAKLSLKSRDAFRQRLDDGCLTLDQRRLLVKERVLLRIRQQIPGQSSHANLDSRPAPQVKEKCQPREQLQKLHQMTL